MKRFIRKISLLLSLVIAFTSIGSTEIYADTVSGQKANPPVNLTEITVIGMSVPLLIGTRRRSRDTTGYRIREGLPYHL